MSRYDSSKIAQQLELNRITNADKQILKGLRSIIEPKLPSIVDEFYGHVAKFPEALAIIERANSSVAKLKTTNGRYFDQIFLGEFGVEYFESRALIGSIHARIELEPKWFFGAMCSYYDTIIPIIVRASAFKPKLLMQRLAALNKAWNLDQSLIMESYINGSVSELLAVTEETSRVIDRLRETSANLGAAGQESNSATTRVASVVEELAAATLSQAESTNSASDQMREVSNASHLVYEGVMKQLTAITKARGMLDETSAVIAEIDRQSAVWQELRKRMSVLQAMRESVQQTGDRVKEMNDRSNEIGRIVQTIDGIAEQTNLLALNAAIEAARAGEHGRGFAVVADQVRKLAENSSTATREISDLIGKVQQGAAGCASAMQEALQGVELVAELTTEAAGCLEHIATSATQATKLTKSVTTSMTEVDQVAHHNSQATEDIAARIGDADQSMQNIAAITEENSSASHEVSAAAHEMRAQVEELLSSVKVIEDEIESLQFIANRASKAASSLGKAA